MTRKRIIIVGASSGMGYGVAQRFIRDGWIVAVAARRKDKLGELKALAPDRVFVEVLDVTEDRAAGQIRRLIDRIGGVDYYFHASGLGLQNPDLIPETEEQTFQVNVLGFGRLIVEVFNFMKEHGGGHIGIISSVAGTRGMGVAPSYSSTKRFQYSYIQALSQLSHMNGYGITFTDIRPGFVATEFLNPDKHYPLMISRNLACDIIYRALRHRRRVKVLDWKFRLVVGFWKCIPRGIWERMNVKN